MTRTGRVAVTGGRCTAAGSLALACVLGLAGCAHSGRPSAPAAAPVAADATARAARWRASRGLYYKRNWGIEVIGVRPVSSGYMLNFRYRILDPEKAKILHDQKTKAYLRDEATGTMLAVPAMENIGELRTGSTPEPGRTYFMIFGDPGKLVKAGSRVSILIGDLHIDDVIVE